MSGIDDLRQRRQTATPVPHRMPAPFRPRTQAVAEGSEVEQEVANAVSSIERVAAADPLVALGVRIPRSLDDRLALLGVQPRVRGVRIIKAELVAHALRQLPTSATDEFAAAVRR
ncbi:MAG: hypothetical protein ACYDC5_05705 [Candidatus Dormibacteria bacterium]